MLLMKQSPAAFAVTYGFSLHNRFVKLGSFASEVVLLSFT